MNDFMAFKKMITPLFIHIIFWIAAGVCVLAGIGVMISGCSATMYSNEAAPILIGVFGGLACILLGPLLVRIWCECLIVVFRINGTLTEILNELKSSEASSQGSISSPLAGRTSPRPDQQAN